MEDKVDCKGVLFFDCPEDVSMNYIGNIAHHETLPKQKFVFSNLQSIAVFQTSENHLRNFSLQNVLSWIFLTDDKASAKGVCSSEAI